MESLRSGACMADPEDAPARQKVMLRPPAMTKDPPKVGIAQRQMISLPIPMCFQSTRLQ